MEDNIPEMMGLITTLPAAMQRMQSYTILDSYFHDNIWKRKKWLKPKFQAKDPNTI